MKKIYSALVAIAISMVTMSNVNAKLIVQQPIPITKNEKQMFVDTKKLKTATTTQEKEQAIDKLVPDIQNDLYATLILEEKTIKEEIKQLEETILQHESYLSYFDNDKVRADKEELAALYEDLNAIQNELNEIRGVQPQVVSRFKEWAVYTLIATVTLAVADQLVTGGKGRETLMAGASTAVSKVGAGLAYLSGTVVGGYALSLAQAKAQALVLQTAFDTTASWLEDAFKNPENVNPNELEIKKKEKADLEQKLKENKAMIEKLEQAQQK